MRRIHMWNISGQVRENIAASKSSVTVGAFCDPRILTAVTIGKDHNHLEPGHYVLIDCEEEGPPQYVTLRIVPALAPYRDNPTVKTTLVGVLTNVNDAVPCLIFYLTDASKEA